MITGAQKRKARILDEIEARLPELAAADRTAEAVGEYMRLVYDGFGFGRGRRTSLTKVPGADVDGSSQIRTPSRFRPFRADRRPGEANQDDANRAVAGDVGARRDMLKARRPAAILFNGIGDYLLNLPALRALEALLPDLTFVCGSWAPAVLGGVSLRTVCEPSLCYNGPGRGYTFDVESVVHKLGECDLLLSLNPFHNVTLGRLLRRLSPTWSVGFHVDFQTALAPDFLKHASDLAFDVPRVLAPWLRPEEYCKPPTFPKESRTFARDLRAMLPKSVRVLAVHAETRPQKMWQRNRFVSFLEQFLDGHSEFMVFVVDRSNQHLDTGRARERIVSCDRLPLTAAVALVAEADLFLGVDSCMLHAADLLGVPGVGLFGPTSSRQFGFRFVKPCRHVCGDGEMDGIDQAAVSDAVGSLLHELA